MEASKLHYFSKEVYGSLNENGHEIFYENKDS